jgi:hypothetical protein
VTFRRKALARLESSYPCGPIAIHSTAPFPTQHSLPDVARGPDGPKCQPSNKAGPHNNDNHRKRARPPIPKGYSSHALIINDKHRRRGTRSESGTFFATDTPLADAYLGHHGYCRFLGAKVDRAASLSNQSRVQSAFPSLSSRGKRFEARPFPPNHDSTGLQDSQTFSLSTSRVVRPGPPGAEVGP